MLYGGDDTDTVAFRYDTNLGQGVTADLAVYQSWGPHGSDRFLEMENLYGSERDDVLRGDAGPNQITGSAGIDECSGGGGADVFSECP